MLRQEMGVQCKCGGLMKELASEHPFSLMEDKSLVVYGKCSKCGSGLNIKWFLTDLLFRCPIDDKNAQ